MSTNAIILIVILLFYFSLSLVFFLINKSKKEMITMILISKNPKKRKDLIQYRLVLEYIQLIAFQKSRI